MATRTVIDPNAGITLNTSTQALTFANAVTISGATTQAAVTGTTADFSGTGEFGGVLTAEAALVAESTITATGAIAANGGITGTTADFSGAGEFGGTLTAEAALVAETTLAVTGVTTPAGGIAPAGGTTKVLAYPGNIHTGGVPATATAEGIDATPVITEIYYSELFVPCDTLVTGISVFNGSVASDDWHRALLDVDGALVAGSATGAVTSTGTDVYQKVPFTGGAITVLGPATYFVAGICDGTTDRYNAHGSATTGLAFSQSMIAGKITAQTYGAIPATNALTYTFTTDLGPIASLY